MEAEYPTTPRQTLPQLEQVKAQYPVSKRHSSTFGPEAYPTSRTYYGCFYNLAADYSSSKAA